MDTYVSLTLEQHEFNLIELVNKQKDELWAKQRMPKTIYLGSHYYRVITTKSGAVAHNFSYFGLRVLEVVGDPYHCKVTD